MSDGGLIQCKVQMPQSGQATVGDILTLSCAGDMPTKLNDPIQLEVLAQGEPDPTQKHILKMWRVAKNDSGNSVGGELVLEVYSHKAGDHNNQKIKITDGVTSYTAENLNWQITSVVKQGDQPAPPWGPLERIYPMWFWLSILGVVLVVAAIVAHFYRRARVRRQLILGVLGEGRESIPFRELVKQQNSQAYAQFSRDLRSVQKKLSAGTSSANKNDPQQVWSEIEKAFRYYLVRELLTPAFSWSRRQLLGDIKKHHRRVYSEANRDLQQILQELDKGHGQNITLQDCEQLFQDTRNAAEKIYKTRTSESKRWRSA